jgi:hypothetical protein
MLTIFYNQVLFITVGVGGVPEGTPELVNGIRNLYRGAGLQPATTVGNLKAAFERASTVRSHKQCRDIRHRNCWISENWS